MLVMGCLIIVILLGFWFYFSNPKAPSTSQSTHPSNPEEISPASVPPSNPTNSPPLTPLQMRAAADVEANREKAIWNLAFMTPIAFYGRVIDEKGNPIEGAKAVMRPADAMMGGNHEYERTTNESGLFSIFTHGLGLTVDVSKAGYYTLSESSGNFGYAFGSGMSPPHPHSNNPAIFILRKMGDAEPLIKLDCNVRISRNGTPVQMSLTAGIRGYAHPGDIQVEAWTHDRDTPQSASKAYDWRCKISVLGGGGLQPRTGGEFDFIAPVDGYQPSDEITMSASDPNWRDSQNREFFLKLANGDYARIDFTMRAGGDHFFRIISYLNPAVGHRNLEFDPAK